MLDAIIVIPEITKGMKSIGSKALLKIHDSLSILEYQIQQLKKYHKKINIHVIAGFEIDKIKKLLNKYKVNILHNDKYISTNQAKCLEIFCHNYTCENLLIISNGVLFKNNPFGSYLNGESKVFLIDKPKSNFSIGCLSDQADNIDYLFYDLPISWSECLYMNKDTISMFQTIVNKNNISQMYLFEAINTMILHNISFNKIYISKKDIMKVNTTKDLNKARLFI
jgi:CTP:phosphocholine cytidylyltransferase-like protein